MYPLRKKKDFWYYISNPFSILLLLIVLGLLVKGVWGIYGKERASSERFRMTEEGFREYSEREAFLQSEIERLQTPKGIEEEVREKFRVAKEDEQLVVIVEPEYEKNSQSVENRAGVWESIKGFFVGE